MKLSKIVKGSVKVVGTVAKVGVELGSEAIGTIAEKIDDKPEEKEKFVSGGKELGQKIKKSTNEIAESSVEVVDNVVDASKKAFHDISQSFKNKTDQYNNQKKEKDSTWENTTKQDTAKDSHKEVIIEGTIKEVTNEPDIKDRSYINIQTAIKTESVE